MSSKLINLLSSALLMACISGDALASLARDARADQEGVKATADLAGATAEYKSTVTAMVQIYERALKSAADALGVRKELFSKGLLSRRELEQAEQALKEAQGRLDETKRQLTESDKLIAAARAEAAPGRSGPAKPTSYATTNAILRSNGSAAWTIAQASKVEDFFSSTFGRTLPISAFGQSSTHERMGLDHRNSVDVALNPDSREGKALISFLEDNGIPFLAFRKAIPGAATGAHIHIGYPSHKTS